MFDLSDLHGISTDVAETYNGLYEETTVAHAKWKIYRQIYAVNSDQIDLLNRTAPAFFYFLQDIWVDDIVLMISRINDRQQTGHGKKARDNLSLARLAAKVKATESAEFYSELDRLLTEIETRCVGLYDLRNRTIAHIDLLTALKIHPDPLPAISRKLIGEVLEMIATFLNKVYSHFNAGTTVHYDVLMHGDGDSVMFFLRQAEKYEAIEEADMRRALGQQ